MAESRERLASITKMSLTVLTTTPLVMSVPLLFMLIIVPAWFRYLGLQSDGIQIQAEVVEVKNAASMFGKPAISVNYRFALQGQDQTVYTGEQSVDFNPPPVGSIVRVTYSRDNPNVSQLSDGPGVGVGVLLLETVLFGVLALVGCIPTVALALKIATRIWGV